MYTTYVSKKIIIRDFLKNKTRSRTVASVSWLGLDELAKTDNIQERTDGCGFVFSCDSKIALQKKSLLR